MKSGHLYIYTRLHAESSSEIDQMEMSGRQLDKSVQILQDDGLLYLGQTGLCLLFEL